MSSVEQLCKDPMKVSNLGSKLVMKVSNLGSKLVMKASNLGI